ncbi:MAG: PspA/IM30 family protein [Desulfobacterales bacterium]|nr:PspA/IM30 family protein [Desulfobacterales bacterium]
MTSFMHRLQYVFKAKLNQSIERIEDPESISSMLIQDMECALVKTKSDVVNAIAAEKRIERELNQHQLLCGNYKKKAEEMLHLGKEELARKSLLRKNEHQQLVEKLEIAWEHAKKNSDNLKERLKKIQNQMIQLKHRQKIIVARQRAVMACEQLNTTSMPLETLPSLIDQFNRMEDRVEGMEMRIEALNELENETESLDMDIAHEQEQYRVEMELAEMKKAMNS